MNELKQEIKSRLLEKLDHSMEMEDEAVQELVENEVWLMGKETYIHWQRKRDFAGKFIMRSGSMMFCRSYWKMKL